MRVKVRLEFPEKLFHEKVLLEWKKSINDANHVAVIKRAYDNLRLYPLNVGGYHELRKIRGIGEDIATRLDAAWKFACANHFTANSAAASDLLQEVRALRPGDALHFLTSAHASKGRRQGGPGGSADVEMQELAQEALNLSMLEQPWREEDQSMLDDSYCEESDENLPPSQITTQSNAAVLTRPMPSIQPEMLTSDPSSIDRCRMVLVVDAREHSGAGRTKRNPSKGKPITEHLQKLEVEYELRALSVGDYLWVLKLGDGRGEMVLDYIVERKTWNDLKSSIRGTRYIEQKRRLHESGIRNVILVAEGAPTKDHSLEQALVTTSIDQRFLIHRTANLGATAKFLKTVGDRLVKRCKVERICGPPFALLQDEGRKTKTITVSSCWMRQLTVCPGMSAEKAQLVCSRFPTFRSLVELYRHSVGDGPLLLHERIPQIPSSLSAQIYQFFSSECR